MKTILFVCTGNTCRSPLAEAVLRKRAEEHGLGVEVKSAGMHGMPGMGMSQGSRNALDEKNIPHSHKSNTVSGELLNWADLVLTMTQDHKRRIIEQFPQMSKSVYTLKEFAYDSPENREKKQKLDREAAELEMKRVRFTNDNRDKVEEYNSNGDVAGQQELERELLEEIRPHREEIDRILEDYPTVDVADPFGGSDEVYRQTLSEIEEAVDRLVERLKQSR
ncbi:low molecular weight protein arginine phosphatase [Alteribacter natronophilus]|uniref:low molecular weight protein arginine phosphatase n=1 Tax=Alteribacter natronophilus TaxID=2583810 RepID=UPI00110F4BFE|nr:low molecular weight protein arginine phosphatase [Alteribacter natronophilus]TMW72157.1 low molecular weight protein arginine phosphatase [Alteribacter natronophilus]